MKMLVRGLRSLTFLLVFCCWSARSETPPAPASGPAVTGQWSDVIALANVPIHTHVLPTGKLLFWGRRSPAGNTPGGSTFSSLNQHETHAFLWDPANPANPGT